MLMINILTI